MASQVPTKTCTKCGVVYAESVEFFDRQKGGRNGLRASCRKCRIVAVTARYRSKHPPVVKDEAWKSRIKENARARSKRWSDKNKEYVAAYRLATRERQREYMARYYPEHREMFVAKTRAWVRANPDRVRAMSSTRRARVLGNGGTHGPNDIAIQYERQNGQCIYCRVQVGSSYHVDHVVPLCRGGSNGPENLVIACEKCNRSKHARLVEEFVGLSA